MKHEKEPQIMDLCSNVQQEKVGCSKRCKSNTTLTSLPLKYKGTAETQKAMGAKTVRLANRIMQR